MWIVLGAFLWRDLREHWRAVVHTRAPALIRKANSLWLLGNLSSILSGMTSSSTPASLRDLYATPPDGWSFFPSPEDLAPLGTKSQAAQWPARSADSHVFNLSPINTDVVSLDLRVVVKSIIASGALQYATTAIAMPFEVGKVLLQIQWIPKEHLAPAISEPDPQEEEEDAVCYFYKHGLCVV